MIEDIQAGRSILAWWLVAVCVAPSLAQQGGAAEELKNSVERKLAFAPTQQQEPDVRAGEAEKRFADGDFRGAAVAFGKQLESRRDDAALLYNLALSRWRAGELDAAEDAIDRYAAAPAGGRPDLHHGLLGNIRYREAEELVREANGDARPSPLQSRAVPGADPAQKQQDPIKKLEDAAGKARIARDEFVLAAGDGMPTPEIARNAERALRLLRDIERQIEERKRQREEQQKQDGQDQQKNDSEKQDEQQKDQQDQQDQKDQKDQKDQQQGEQKKDQQQDRKDPQEQPKQQKDDSDSKDQPSEGEERPEPKPDAAQRDKQQDAPQDGQQGQPDQDPAKDAAANEPKGDGEDKPEPKPLDGEPKGDPQDAQQAPRRDAPGEQVDATQLSPEQRARLMEQLKDLDARMREIRMQSRSRRPVDRDW